MGFGETTSEEIERVAREIVDAAFKVHSKLGPGLLESAYRTVMVYELRKRGLSVRSEVPVPVVYEEVRLEAGYRLHGGFDAAGNYISPRTLNRWPAIRAWSDALTARGHDLVDASQLGGSFYESFSDVKTAFGGLAITRISLVMDGPSQTSQFDNTLVNATTYTYEPPPCTETGLMRDGINLTAKIVNPTTSVTGAVNATGCNIGVYFGDGHSGTVSGANISGANYYGVVADGAAVDITADIHDIGENPLNGSQHGVAVLYTTVHQSGSTTSHAATGTLSGSTITHYQKNGVVVSGAGASVNVLNNTVTGQGHINSIAQNGIQISAGASALVKGNTVSGNWYTPATVTACGLLFFQAGGVKQQMNNLFDNQTNLCNAGRGGGGTSAG